MKKEQILSLRKLRNSIINMGTVIVLLSSGATYVSAEESQNSKNIITAEDTESQLEIEPEDEATNVTNLESISTLNEEDMNNEVQQSSNDILNLNVESIEVYPNEGEPGDYISVSMEASQSLEISNFTVSFRDLNNVGPTIALQYNPDSDRFEGKLLLEDNLREGKLRITSIIINSDKERKIYYDVTSSIKIYENIDFSPYTINLVGSHGPYIEESSIEIDPVTHPEKTTGLSFKIVNPQYVSNSFGISLIAKFEGPIKVNSSYPDVYYNTFEMDEEGNVKSDFHYAYEDDDHIDGVYSLNYVNIPILNAEKTDEQYNTSTNFKDISFEYRNHYTSRPIFELNGLMENQNLIIETDNHEFVIPSIQEYSREQAPQLMIEWVEKESDKTYSESLYYDYNEGVFKANNTTSLPSGKYIVDRIAQYINGEKQYVYNSSLYPSSEYKLDSLNMKILPIDSSTTSIEEKDADYSGIITVKNKAIFSNLFGSGDNQIIGRTSDYPSGREVKVEKEVINEFGTWLKIEIQNEIVGWVEKEAIRPLTVNKTLDVTYVATVINPWSINTEPWGTEGYELVESAAQYLGGQVNVIQEKITERSSYALIQTKGKTLGWIDTTGLEKYKVLSTTDKTYSATVIKPWSINSAPWGTENASLLYDGADYVGKEVVVTREKVTQRGTYALVKSNGKELGWIDTTGIKSHEIQSEKNVNYVATITKPWSVNTEPWGVKGFKTVISDSRLVGETVNVLKESKTPRSSFVLLEQNGKVLGWIDETGVKKDHSILAHTDISYNAVISRPWSINSKPYGSDGYKRVAEGKEYMDKEVTVLAEQITDRSTYVLIQHNGKEIGWIDITGITPHRVLSEKKTDYTVTITKPWSINTLPWGIRGFEQVDTGQTYLNKEVKVIAEQKTPRSTYMLIEQNGKELGWIDGTGVSKR